MREESEADPIEIVDRECFVFAEGSDYLRGFLSAANAIARDFGEGSPQQEADDDVEAEVLDLKQGLAAAEERARTELGMIHADETFYQIAPAPRAAER